MAWFRCVGSSGGGGGGTTPEFTKTVILDNSSLSNTLTWDYDYADYDFLECELYNTSSDTSFKLITTPEIITALFANSEGRCTFNETATNQYICYTKSSNTSWSRYGGRNLVLKAVTGWICSNMNVVKAEIYDREDYSSSNVEIELSSGSFYDYDYLFMCACTGTSDESIPNNYILCIDDETFNAYPIGFVLCSYNSKVALEMTSTKLSAGRYCYVQGVRFV